MKTNPQGKLSIIFTGYVKIEVSIKPFTIEELRFEHRSFWLQACDLLIALCCLLCCDNVGDKLERKGRRHIRRPLYYSEKRK